ncbi:Metallo-dependent phosphatase-like protein [Catenaria anguillulae PL171]|uniref:Metallo-dependent phosphatase-like protein n=1 Tax=Catenaria anguillulae PL171 TaxID=765915 RepID=A0A1Y2HM24_9FUNG|nr:Metallo-dependent phosphatase-like protein [Catenaria anguillulae PL171]
MAVRIRQASSPNPQIDREAFPCTYPGHEPQIHLPVYGAKPSYGRRPLPTQPPTDGRNNETVPAPKPWKVGTQFTGQPGEPYVPGYGGEKLIKRPLPGDNQPFEMTLLHTNDIHGRMDEFSRSGLDCTAKDYANKTCFGGIARMKTVIDQIRATEPNVYLLDAGDQFQGNLFYSYYKGSITANYMNAFGYDAFAIGNHEFDDGVAHLGNFIRNLAFPALSSNMDTSRDPSIHGLVAPYIVLTKHNTRIGVVGYITPTVTDISGNLGDKLRFTDPVGPVQRAVDELRNKLNVQRIICLSHNGYQEDMAVARATRGFALIVGGHSHTLLHNDPEKYREAKGPYPTKVTNLDGQDVYIVQAKMWSEWLGHLSLTWSATNRLTHINGSPIHLTLDVPQHNATQEIVKKWREPFDAATKVVIGTSAQPLPNGAACKSRGCGLGYLVADVVRQSYSGQLGRDVPVFALQHEGGLRSSIPEGPITVGSIMSLLPFGNVVVEMRVTGEFVVEMLENLATAKHKRNGRPVTAFGQFAGLRARADRTRPEFAKVVPGSVQVRVQDGSWAPLNLKQEYVMLTNEFIAGGGDNMLPEPRPNLLSHGVLGDLVMDYVKKVKTVVVPEERGFELVN